MLKIAITGILACGKSSVTHYFKECGAYTVSADRIVHDLLAESDECKKALVDLLGEEVLVDGNISRERVGQLVFQQPDRLAELEALLHPMVRDEVERHYQQAVKEQQPLFVAEIPLLFESKTEFHFDKIIAVEADKEACVARFMNRTRLPEAEFHKRMEHQLSQEEKVRRADLVIKNKGSLDELKQETTIIYNQLLTPQK